MKKRILNATDDEIMQVMEARQILIDLRGDRKRRKEAQKPEEDPGKPAESQSAQRPLLGLPVRSISKQSITTHDKPRVEPFDSKRKPEQLSTAEYAKRESKTPKKKGEGKGKEPKEQDEEAQKKEPKGNDQRGRELHSV